MSLRHREADTTPDPGAAATGSQHSAGLAALRQHRHRACTSRRKRLCVAPPRVPARKPPLTRTDVSCSLPLVVTDQKARLAVLGDPTRLAIFELLGDGPRAEGELASHLPVTRPAVSQHLKVLKDAGLVIDQPHGTRRLYQLDPQGIAEVRAYFDRFWDHALASFQ